MSLFTERSKEELLELQRETNQCYEQWKKKKLSLDMSRGKPSPTQIDCANGLLAPLEDYHTKEGLDVRNYGVLDGIPEMKQIFSDLLHIAPEQIIIGGNSSLNMMFDTIMRLFVFGTQGHTPWGKLDHVKFLCPSPGYDRHFTICETLGIQMIPIAMKGDGPDMDEVSRLAASDESIKGMWCVPKYSNPQGICYSDQVVEQLASMKTAAPDFRIFWDNAYGVHYIFEDVSVKNILDVCREAGTPDRPYYFFSTSKITFPGAGVGMIAASNDNIKEIKRIMSAQTIGYDKVNQLRHVRMFQNAQGVKDQMDRLANAMRPKFEIVLRTLNQELNETGLAKWMEPRGGYFVSVDVLSGCAGQVIKLAKEAGVVMTGAGAAFPYHKDPADENIRIAPTYPTEEELQQAMDLFCVCVKKAGIDYILKGKMA